MTLRFRVEKLIRDRLPAMMQAQGLKTYTRRLDDGAFDQALRAKLIEEAEETRTAPSRDLLEELADVTEVVLALAELHGFTAEDVEAARITKRAERGGFDERVYNAAVEGEPDNPAVAYYLARPAQYPPS